MGTSGEHAPSSFSWLAFCFFCVEVVESAPQASANRTDKHALRGPSLGLEPIFSDRPTANYHLTQLLPRCLCERLGPVHLHQRGPVPAGALTRPPRSGRVVVAAKEPADVISSPTNHLGVEVEVVYVFLTVHHLYLENTETHPFLPLHARRSAMRNREELDGAAPVRPDPRHGYSLEVHLAVIPHAPGVGLHQQQRVLRIRLSRQLQQSCHA